MTVNDILTDARKIWLGDEDSDLYTEAYLLDHGFRSAFSELNAKLRNVGGLQVMRTGYIAVVAGEGAVALPEEISGNLARIDARNSTLYGASAMTRVDASTIRVDIGATPPFAVGAQVEISRVLGLPGVNTSGSVVAIAGSSVDVRIFTQNRGLFDSTGAYLSYATGQWVRVAGPHPLPMQGVVGGPLMSVAVEGNILQFQSQSESFVFRVYGPIRGGSIIATTDEVAFEDARNFLAIRTAMIAAGANLAQAKRAELSEEAFGPGGPNSSVPSGGALMDVMRAAVRASQTIQRARPAHWSATRTWS